MKLDMFFKAYENEPNLYNSDLFDFDSAFNYFMAKFN